MSSKNNKQLANASIVTGAFLIVYYGLFAATSFLMDFGTSRFFLAVSLIVSPAVFFNSFVMDQSRLAPFIVGSSVGLMCYGMTWTALWLCL